MNSTLTINRFDRLIESLTLSALLVCWGYSAYLFQQMPAIIPIHFDMKNNPDNYGSRLWLFSLPVIATALYILFGFIAGRPSKLNHVVKITAENQQRQYSYTLRLLRYMKLAIILVFIFITYNVYASINNTNESYLRYSLWFSVGLILLPLVIYIAVATRNR